MSERLYLVCFIVDDIPFYLPYCMHSFAAGRKYDQKFAEQGARSVDHQHSSYSRPSSVMSGSFFFSIDIFHKKNRF